MNEVSTNKGENIGRNKERINRNEGRGKRKGEEKKSPDFFLLLLYVPHQEIVALKKKIKKISFFFGA